MKSNLTLGYLPMIVHGHVTRLRTVGAFPYCPQWASAEGEDWIRGREKRVQQGVGSFYVTISGRNYGPDGVKKGISSADINRLSTLTVIPTAQKQQQ